MRFLLHTNLYVFQRNYAYFWSHTPYLYIFSILKTWHPLSVLWLFSFENFVCDSVDLPLWIHCDFHNVPLWFIVRIIIHSIYKLIFDWYNSKQDPKILLKPSTVLEELIKRQIYYFHQKNFDILGFWYFLTGNSNLSLVFSLDETL